MTPTKTELTKCIGIMSGLGAEELVIDWAKLIPDDAVTVAFDGDNGTGKSTLLQFGMTPIREPHHIEGSVYDHFEHGGARVLEFTHGGDSYKSEIRYSITAKTRGQRAYLYKDGEHYVTATGIESDGKSSTYDACLTELLGEADLYYLAAFQAQGAPKLAEYDDAKSLLVGLLGLNTEEALRDQAKEVRRVKRIEHDAFRAQLPDISETKEDLAEIEAEIEASPPAEMALTSSLDRAELTAATARREYQDALDADAATASVKAEIEELKEKQSNINSEAAAIDGDYATRIHRESDIHIIDTGEIMRRIDAESSIVNRETEISGARAKLTTLVNDETELGKAQTRNAQIKDELAEARRKTTELMGQQTAGKQKLARMDRDITDATETSKLMDIVPFGDKCAEAGCQFVERAASAKKTLPNLIKEAADYSSLNMSSIDSMLALSKEREESLKKQLFPGDIEGSLRRLKAEIDETATVAGLAAQLDGAKERKASAEEELKQAETANAERKSKATAAVSALEAEKQEKLDALRSEWRGINERIMALEKSTPESIVSTAAESMREEDEKRDRALDALNQHKARVSSLTAKRDALAREIADAQSGTEELTAMADTVASWDLLAKGLQGVIDLTIEDAGPAIAATANRLLRDAYGPRFSVRVVTQREQANGKLVECFDVTVIDSEKDRESSVLMKSGGESVWINKALIDAVSLHHKETAGIDYETKFADEADDGLRASRKGPYYQMDRSALQAGGYTRKYFVSHSPEAIEMADFVVRMEDLKAGGESGRLLDGKEWTQFPEAE